MGEANSHSAPEHGRHIRDEAAALATSVDAAASDFRHQIERNLRARPYTTLAVAAAAGFILGGGIATSLTRFLITTGGRLALALAVKRVGETVEQALGIRAFDAEEDGALEVSSAPSRVDVG